MASTDSPRQDDGQHDEQHDKGQDKTTTHIPKESRPSLMQRKFMAADAAGEDAKADWDRRAITFQKGKEKDRERKELYFFYGSLMDPAQLQRVLGLTDRPRDLRPA
ncbi:hypothetical protein Daus18300_001083 [Diaporthe australafricana]|uniref:Gamma-glutamylcyclotransferase AIG2-like domain-containing protein n=1 Tax=Diaporthe australafricana TaxID=127596 RepID=A0ABR3Y0C6_9PEZI